MKEEVFREANKRAKREVAKAKESVYRIYMTSSIR